MQEISVHKAITYMALANENMIWEIALNLISYTDYNPQFFMTKHAKSLSSQF